jgi:succinate-semialdehyde dehydrogenase / glutarate-semialdehyde dehydrogenase
MSPQTVVNPATRVYRTINPATGEVVQEFSTVNDSEAEALLDRAHQAYFTWRDRPISDRVAASNRMATVLDAYSDEIARRISLEMGKPYAQSLGEVGMAAEMFRYYGNMGEQFLADEVLEVDGFAHVVTRRESVGVVLGIEPWNGPVYQAMRVAAPNLLLGNSVLLKPSEVSAYSSTFFDGLFVEAGYPQYLYQTTLISTSHVSGYIADARVRAVTLTGSDRAGAAVGEQAGRHIKPVVLELGGSDAFVVLDSADVSKAVAAAASCRLFLGGQMCCSPKRVIVTDAVADRFIPEFIEAFASQVVGDPFDPATTVGPMASQTACDILHEQYMDAVSKGATVLLDGGRVEAAGSYFKPAVLTGITPHMRLYREEAFGPLGMVYRVHDADAAVELANSSQYGLGGTVFAEDLDEAHRVARALDTGGVGINQFLGGTPVQMPFGGTKRSGVGRELGRFGLDAFSNIKTYGRG